MLSRSITTSHHVPSSCWSALMLRANNDMSQADGHPLFRTASPAPADEIFLEEPRSRIRELITLMRVMRDFLRGFRSSAFVGPCVTVFGSARIKRHRILRSR